MGKLIIMVLCVCEYSYIIQNYWRMRKQSINFDEKFRRKRVMSAHNLCNGTQRPVSSISHRKDSTLKQQKQTIPNLFKLASGSTLFPRQQTLLSRESLLFNPMLKQPPTKSIPLEKEELYLDNLKLKKHINKLQKQLSILKGKYEAKTSREFELSQKYQKQYDRGLYWMGNKSHMIAGVKRQYQLLKKQYQAKSKQYQQANRTLLETKIPELTIYIQQLQKQNSRLKHKLQNIIDSQQKIKQLTINHNDAPLSQILIALSQQAEELILKCRQKQAECDNLNSIISEKQQKISILERMIIERENSKFHHHRSNLHLEKQVKDRKEEIRRLLDVIESMKIRNLAESQKFRVSMEGKITELRGEIQGKEKIIGNLEASGKQMEKTLHKLKLSHLENTSHKSRDLQYSAFTTSNNNLLRSSIGFNFHNHSNHRDEQLTQSIQINRLKRSNTNSKFAQDIVQEQDVFFQQQSQQPEPQKKREKVSASIKYFEGSQRLQRVKMQDITDIVQIIRFRVIGTETTPECLKNLLGYKNYLREDGDRDDETISITSSEKWDRQYINMRKLKNILQAQPLILNQHQAQLIARYIVEDSEEQGYVYSNDFNQQNREIAKSILRAIVGQYQLSNEATKQAVSSFMKKYATNLQAALNDLYPDKSISQQNFCQLLKSLGMEASQKQKEYLVSLMSLHSESLSALRYDHLFT